MKHWGEGYRDCQGKGAKEGVGQHLSTETRKREDHKKKVRNSKRKPTKEEK